MKFKPKAKNFKSLRREHPLNPVFAQADYLRQLEEEINPFLAPSLLGKVHVMRFDMGDLYLQVESSIGATQLRFAQSQLLRKLLKSKNFNQLEKIHIKVRHLATNKVKRERKPSIRPSAESAETLLITAELVDHEGLKEALTKLASRHRP
ncbi:MAG: hypothetical protein COB04_04810 [Gammaproteobacteria bacterium]|nr:MAG: hypothetical protein COB04_04810 [Gammaproteobacteria bacterium]